MSLLIKEMSKAFVPEVNSDNLSGERETQRNNPNPVGVLTGVQNGERELLAKSI